jgi:hypothetical protein
MVVISYIVRFLAKMDDIKSIVAGRSAADCVLRRRSPYCERLLLLCTSFHNLKQKNHFFILLKIIVMNFLAIK